MAVIFSYEYFSAGFGIMGQIGGSELGFDRWFIAAVIGRQQYGDTTLTWVAKTDSPSAETPPQLLNNFPNPFNGGTAIPFALVQRGPLKLLLSNILGREIEIMLTRTWIGDTAESGLIAGTLLAVSACSYPKPKAQNAFERWSFKRSVRE